MAVEIVGEETPLAVSMEILVPSVHRGLVSVGFELDHLVQVLRVLSALG